MSQNMAMQSLQSAISMNVLAKSMNQDQMSVEFITDSLEKIDTVQTTPSFGHIFDIIV